MGQAPCAGSRTLIRSFLAITSNPIAAAILTGVKLDRRPAPTLLTAKQAAKLLRVSTDKVYEMCR